MAFKPYVPAGLGGGPLPSQRVGAAATAGPQPDYSGLDFLNHPAPDYSGLDFLNHLNDGGGAAPSGGGGGGGFAAAAAPPAPVLESSPEWLAYINALGLQKGQFAADVARQREMAGAQAGFQSANLKPQFEQQRRGITAGAEGRGMTRSGAFQRDLSYSKGQENKQQAGLYMGLTNTLSNLESQLAAKNLALDTQRQQQYATMLGQGYQSNGLYQYLASLGK